MPASSVLDLLDLLDLPELHFLHREARLLVAALDPRRAAALQLLRPLPCHDNEFELVHSGSFPLTAKDAAICATAGAITRDRARSASTIARRRSTQLSNSSLTMTYSYSATARTSRRAVASRFRMASSESLLRPRSRCSSAANVGGSTNTPIVCAPRERTCRAP